MDAPVGPWSKLSNGVSAVGVPHNRIDTPSRTRSGASSTFVFNSRGEQYALSFGPFLLIRRSMEALNSPGYRLPILGGPCALAKPGFASVSVRRTTHELFQESVHASGAPECE
jgi:hypothetical protein